jgi:hypothetical protein
MKGIIIGWFIAVVVIGIGWVLNIINIVHALQAGTEVTAVLIAQLVGVALAPLGAILGYVL